jgi:hypothetical protein
MRTFPKPDRLLRHIDENMAPDAWVRMTGYEKSLRGRYAIVAMCAGFNPAKAWAMALEPSARASIERDLATLTDMAIEEMVRAVRLKPSGARFTGIVQ